MDAIPDGLGRKRPFSTDNDDDDDVPEFVAKKQRSTRRLKSAFESIFERYGRDFSGVGDEVDLETGELVVDNGHLEGMVQELDNGATNAPRSSQSVRRRGRKAVWSMWAPAEVKSRAIGYMTSETPVEEEEADDTSAADSQSEHEFQEELLQQIRTHNERQQAQEATKIKPTIRHSKDNNYGHAEPLRFAEEPSDGHVGWSEDEINRLIELRRRGIYFSEMEAYFVGKKQATLAQKWRRLVRDRPDLEPNQGDLLAKALAEINAGRLRTHHTKAPFRRFSEEEDDLLVSLRQRNLQFIQMVPQFSGRDEGALCRRFRVLSTDRPELRALLGRIYHPAQAQTEDTDGTDGDALPTKNQVLSKRFHATLDPWTAEEDSLVLILAAKGVKFDDMSSFLKDRSGSTIKSRWFRLRREGNDDWMLSDGGKVGQRDDRRKSAPGQFSSTLADIEVRSRVPRTGSEDDEYKPARVPRADKNLLEHMSRRRRKSSRLQQTSDDQPHYRAKSPSVANRHPDDDTKLPQSTSKAVRPPGDDIRNVVGKNQGLGFIRPDEIPERSGDVTPTKRPRGRPRKSSFNHVLDSHVELMSAVQSAKPKRRPGRPRKFPSSNDNASPADDGPPDSRARAGRNVGSPPSRQHDSLRVSGAITGDAQAISNATSPRNDAGSASRLSGSRVMQPDQQHSPHTGVGLASDGLEVRIYPRATAQSEPDLPSLPESRKAPFTNSLADAVMDTDHETSLSAMPSSSENAAVRRQSGRSQYGPGRGQTEERNLRPVEEPLENESDFNHLSGSVDSDASTHVALESPEKRTPSDNELLRNSRGLVDLSTDTPSTLKQDRKQPLEKRQMRRQSPKPPKQVAFQSQDDQFIGTLDAENQPAKEASGSRHVLARKPTAPRRSLPSSMSLLVSRSRAPLSTTPQSNAKARTVSSRPAYKTPLQHVFRRSGFDADDSSEDELCTPGRQPARPLIMT